MKITNKYYNKLIKFKEKYPALTFDNNGYEYLSKEIKEKYKNEIKEISNILKKTIKGFVEFNNFKPRENNNFDIRVQYRWDRMFTGVGYFKIELFKNFKKDFSEQL